MDTCLVLVTVPTNSRDQCVGAPKRLRHPLKTHHNPHRLAEQQQQQHQHHQHHHHQQHQQQQQQQQAAAAAAAAAATTATTVMVVVAVVAAASTTLTDTTPTSPSPTNPEVRRPPHAGVRVLVRVPAGGAAGVPPARVLRNRSPPARGPPPFPTPTNPLPLSADYTRPLFHPPPTVRVRSLRRHGRRGWETTERQSGAGLGRRKRKREGGLPSRGRARRPSLGNSESGSRLCNIAGVARDRKSR